MSEEEQKPLTPKDGCEECQRLRDWVESARKAKAYLANDSSTGYRSDKSRSTQYKNVRDHMDSNDDSQRLAQATLRMHEIETHEGHIEANSREFIVCMQIKMRDGRDRA
jgi:hypothetical protein